MKQRTLGRTGLSVSEIGFGAVEIGTEYGIQVAGRPNRPTTEDAIRIVHRALDLGVNAIDTARAYGDSEQILGQALQGRRDSVVLMSKAAAIDPELTGDAVTSFMDDSIETSLRLLATDVIDVYQLHSPPAEQLRRSDVLDQLERYRKAGKVRFLGATVYTEEEAFAAIDDPRIDVLQIAYSMLDSSMNDRVIPAAAKSGVGLVARSVLHRGVLTEKGGRGSAEERRLHQAAAGFDFLFDDQTQSLHHAALRFVLSNQDIHCAILGMDSVEQVEENLSFGEIRPFSADQIQRVRSSAPPNPWSIIPARK